MSATFKGVSSQMLCRTCFYVVINHFNNVFSSVSVVARIHRGKNTLYELTTKITTSTTSIWHCL